MKIMNKFVLFGFTILFLSSCGSYKPYYDPYSAIVRRIGENIFNVKYNGKTTNLQNAVDFCLLRCCEVSLERGYKYFRVTSSEKGIYSFLVKAPDLQGYIGGSPVIIEGGYNRSAPKAIADNVIYCTNQLPSNRDKFIDAAQQAKTIRSKYENL